MGEIYGFTPDKGKLPENDHDSMTPHALPHEAPRPIEKMRREAEIDPLADLNDNALANVGDWVSIKNAQNQKLVCDHLETTPPLVVGRIEGEFAYIVPRSIYKPGLFVPITPREMRAKTVPAWGIPLTSLKLEIKPSIVK